MTALLGIAVVVTPQARARSGEPGEDRSGGRAVAHHSEGRIIKAPGVTSRAPDARVFDIGHDAVEPTLGLTKDGQIFYTAAGSRNEVVTSKDNGRTWKVVSPQLGGRNVHAITLDPYIFVDEDTGRVFTIDLTVACSLMSFSDDRGKTWTTNPLACGRPVNDHQTLFGGPPVSSPTIGYENIMYYCWNDVATSSCGKSLDGGITWRATGQPAFHPGDGTEGQSGMRHCGGLHGHGVVARDGTVYLPKEHCEEPWLSISHDEGTTWEHVRVSNKVAIWGPDPSVAVDNKGNIYYVFLSKDRLPYIATSRDGGETWSRPVMLGFPGLTETVLATLDVGAPGKIAVAYYGTDEVSGKIEDRTYEGVKWNGYITMSSNIFAEDPVFYSGNVNDPKYPFAMGDCGPRRCQEALDFIDVVVGFDGTPWAAFADSCVMVCEGLSVGNTGAAARMVGGPSLR
ncbi:MAG: glycoside hydrolase [Actinomycetota bacterium]|nr:glycoside hydrolase [Actinomycetota bacterium]